MVSMTIPLEESFSNELEKFSWINWSELAREELIKQEERIKLFEKLEELTKNSTLTDDDIIELSKKARKGRFKELKRAL